MQSVRLLGALALACLPSFAFATAANPVDPGIATFLAPGLTLLGLASLFLFLVVLGTSRAPRVAAVIGLGALLAFVVAPAFAQETRVPLGGFYELLRPYLELIVASSVAALMAWLADMVHTKFKIAIPQERREALQVALTNAAGLLIAKGGAWADGQFIDVKGELFADAVRYVEQSAPQAVKHFKLTPADILEKIQAKIPQVAPLPLPRRA